MTPKFDPDYICLLLESAGYKAQLQAEEHGSAVLFSGAHGFDFRIIFVMSEDDTGFGMMAFTLDVTNEERLSLQEVNEFNAASMAATLFLDGADELCLRLKCPVPWNFMNEEIFTRYFAPWLQDIRSLAKISV